MQRREFIGLIGGAAAAWPLPAFAQQRANLPLVAVIIPFGEDIAIERTAALRLGLKQAGLVEGKDYALAVRFGNGDFSRVAELAKELDALKPRVFVSLASVSVIHQQVPNTPLVFTGVAVDVIALGIAQSYARPGGMVTGNVQNAVGGEESLVTKRIGLFKELLPGLTRLGWIGFADSETPTARSLAIPERNALRKASAQLGYAFLNYDIRTLDDFDSAVSSGLRDDVSAFYISGDPRINADVPRVVASLARSGKPTCASYPLWARAGLLMAYANDGNDGMRHAGFQVAKIIHGAKPGDLPIEQADKYLLVVNLKTAKSLGITVPATLQAQADEVIE